MKFMLVLSTGLSLITLCIRTAEAQEQKRERPRIDASFFDRLDANKDGIVTMDEIPAERLENAKRIFDRLDSDRGGKLTRAEFEAGMARARARMKSEPAQAKRPEPAQETTPPATQAKPDEPRRPEENPRPGQPPLGARPGAPPFGFPGPDLFRALDSDNDGKLSKAELARAVDVLMKYDKNGDGVLTREELADGLRASLPPGAPQPPGFPPGDGRFLEAMIQRMDKNGDGKLSKDEVPDMLRERFDELDKNKDGLLDR